MAGKRRLASKSHPSPSASSASTDVAAASESKDDPEVTKEFTDSPVPKPDRNPKSFSAEENKENGSEEGHDDDDDDDEEEDSPAEKGDLPVRESARQHRSPPAPHKNTPPPHPSKNKSTRSSQLKEKPMPSSPRDGHQSLKPPNSSKGSRKRPRNDRSLDPKALSAAQEKPPAIQRLWSFEDEEALLHALLDYRHKKDMVPMLSQEMILFRTIAQPSLKGKFTTSQLCDKVRRLKQKFEAHIRKNVDHTFSTTHERICYELSKRLWDLKEDGNQNGRSEEEGQDTNQNKSAKGVSKHEVPYMWDIVDRTAIELSCGVAMEKSMEKLDIEAARALDAKAKKLKLKEIKLHLEKIDLVKEVVKSIADSLSTA